MIKYNMGQHLNQKFEYVIILDDELFGDESPIDIWLQENVHGRWKNSYLMSGIRYEFEDIEDATLFMLFWGEYIMSDFLSSQ